VQLIGASGLAVDGSARFDGPGGRPWDFVLSGDGRTYADLISPEGLREIARYADGIGPWKRLVIPTRGADRDGDGRADDVNGDGRVDERDRRSAAPTDLVHDAHAAGLFVHPWTFRAEPDTLPADFEGDPVAEIRQFMEAGVDGVFSDFPDLAVKARGTAR
jgi:glycerophosphoryl diester phosphodiesterase